MTVATLEYMALPEGVYPIVEATLYLATAPKSNTANAYFKAYEKVEAEGKVQVPKHLQDGNRDAPDLGHGEGYVYPHAEPGHHVGQQYLPTALLGTYFYSPSQEGYEAQSAWDRADRYAAGYQPGRDHQHQAPAGPAACMRPDCG
jgi:putative ATPase